MAGTNPWGRKVRHYEATNILTTRDTASLKRPGRLKVRGWRKTNCANSKQMKDTVTILLSDITDFKGKKNYQRERDDVEGIRV